MRPRPPSSLGQFTDGDAWPVEFAPAQEVLAWAFDTFVREGAQLRNEDHTHLESASVAFMWAASGFERQGRRVLGLCEEVTFRCGPWQKGRQQQQMMQWFGYVPQFLITLAADYCAECSDAEFCALVEHEMYHIGHLRDEFGAPKFTKEGGPRLGMRAHDVEEFVGVVRRYGPSQQVYELVSAANSAPAVTKINVARACGTCLLHSA